MRAVPLPSPAMPRVDALVTGATGLIGAHVVEQLVAAGKSVRCMLRASSDTTALRRTAPEAELVEADLSAAGSSSAHLADAVSGARVVLHIAGHLHVGSPLNSDETDEQYDLNVDSTRRLLAASRDAGVERFVYASSVAVYDPEEESPIAEDGPAIPRSAYGRSKLAAEQLVFEHHREGLPGTVVRPAIVYGAGDRHFLPAVRRVARLPLLTLPAGGRNVVDVAAAPDVAAVLIASADASVAAGRVYNAASGHPTSLRELLQALHDVEGTPMPRIVPAPAVLVRLTAPIARRLLANAAPGMEGIVGSIATRYGRRDVFYDMGRTAQELGVRPQHTFRSGLLSARGTQPVDG